MENLGFEGMLYINTDRGMPWNSLTLSVVVLYKFAIKNKSVNSACSSSV